VHADGPRRGGRRGNDGQVAAGGRLLPHPAFVHVGGCAHWRLSAGPGASLHRVRRVRGLPRADAVRTRLRGCTGAEGARVLRPPAAATSRWATSSASGLPSCFRATTARCWTRPSRSCSSRRAARAAMRRRVALWGPVGSCLRAHFVAPRDARRARGTSSLPRPSCWRCVRASRSWRGRCRLQAAALQARGAFLTPLILPLRSGRCRKARAP